MYIFGHFNVTVVIATDVTLYLLTVVDASKVIRILIMGKITHNLIKRHL